jgi:hypothetical protein
MPIKFVVPHHLRQYNISNAVASARIEGIALTSQFQKNLTDYVAGKKSIVQLPKEAKHRNAINSIR